jgi:hypothetical protein
LAARAAPYHPSPEFDSLRRRRERVGIASGFGTSMRFIPSLFAIVAAALCPAAGQIPAAAGAARGDGPVVVVPIQGELDEAMVTLTMRAVRVARERQARSLVFEIDSEGGNIGLMDRLIPSFLSTLSSQKIKGTRVLLQ